MLNRIYIAVFFVFCITFTAEAGWFEEDLLKEAEKDFIAGNYADTIEKCEGWLDLTKGRKRQDKALYLLGMSLLKSGSYTSSRDIFATILSNYRKGEFADDAFLALADTYYLEGNLSEAMHWYRALCDKHPKSPLLATAYYKLGRINKDLGKKEEANKYFLMVKEDFADSFEAHQIKDVATSRLCVQIGLFKNESNANEIKKKLTKYGYAADINTLDDLYRVYVGDFLSNEEAEDIRRRLAKDGFKGVVRPW